MAFFFKSPNRVLVSQDSRTLQSLTPPSGGRGKLADSPLGAHPQFCSPVIFSARGVTDSPVKLRVDSDGTVLSFDPPHAQQVGSERLQVRPGYRHFDDQFAIAVCQYRDLGALYERCLELLSGSCDVFLRKQEVVNKALRGQDFVARVSPDDLVEMIREAEFQRILHEDGHLQIEMRDRIGTELTIDDHKTVMVSAFGNHRRNFDELFEDFGLQYDRELPVPAVSGHYHCSHVGHVAEMHSVLSVYEFMQIPGIPASG